MLKAVIESGQKTGKDLLNNETKISKKDTTGNAYCKRKKAVKSNFLLVCNFLEIRKGQ